MRTCIDPIGPFTLEKVIMQRYGYNDRMGGVYDEQGFRVQVAYLWETCG